MTKVVLALVSPLFNLFLLYHGKEFFGWLSEMVIEARIDGQTALKSVRDEILQYIRCYSDVNSLMAGFATAVVGAVAFIALDSRPAIRFVLPLCYLVLWLRISQRLRDIRRFGEMSGYNLMPESPDGTKSNIRKLRFWTLMLSTVPALAALFDQVFGTLVSMWLLFGLGSAVLALNVILRWYRGRGQQV